MYQNDQDPSLPIGSDIFRYIWTCRASAIYDIPINWRYIQQRCPALLSSRPPEDLSQFTLALTLLIFGFRTLGIVLLNVPLVTTNWTGAEMVNGYIVMKSLSLSCQQSSDNVDILIPF